jgi:hypothetical protein
VRYLLKPRQVRTITSPILLLVLMHIHTVTMACTPRACNTSVRLIRRVL